VEQAYRRTLARSLRHTRLVLGAAAALFVGAVLVLRSLPSEFVPSQDQSRLLVRLQTAVGSDIGETDQLFRRAEDLVRGRSEVRRCFAVVGGGGPGVNTGILFLTLVPPGERALNHQEFSAVLRRGLNSIPGLKAVVQDPSQQGFTARRGFPVEFSVRGSDWDGLVATSGNVTRELDASGLVVDLDTDYEVGMPELRIFPDRARCADLGIPVEDVATAINALVGGVRVGKYSEGGRRLDVRLRLLAQQRSRPEDIGRLRVRTAAGDLVPLSAVVATEERPALQSITRRDRERAITVSANVAPGHSLEEALAKVDELGHGLPVGYRLVLGGASVAFRDSMGSLLFALFLGVAVAYMVLASQFNSLLHPTTVLTILPLSVAGAAAALWASGKTLNIFSMIGLLLLLGIAKKNSIILVDYALQMREAGKDAREAMLVAGPRRLRPILMTSVATMMAALPPALGIGPGSEIRTPMAIAVIGGLVVSTALSLLVVPSFFVATNGCGWGGSTVGGPPARGARPRRPLRGRGATLLTIPLSNARIGIFVDGTNVSLHGGHGMRYDVLREVASRDGAEPVRMNVYVSYDAQRGAKEAGYRRGQENFCSVLRDFGYKVVQRNVREALDEDGKRCVRSRVAMDLAVDALSQAANLERVLLVSGDEDFVPVVQALQSRGLRVEVIGFEEVAPALREAADSFLSGYLIPNLLPIPDQPDRAAWGELGHRARGVCYNHGGKGYGFLRYIRRVAPGLWITDSRHPESPYETVFFHDSQLPRSISASQLPSRSIVFEFELAKSDRFEDDFQAINLRLVSGAGRAAAESGPESNGGRRGRHAAEERWGEPEEEEEERWSDELDEEIESEEIGADDDSR
jgi:uncharacterized LabA/DUF88 family protein